MKQIYGLRSACLCAAAMLAIAGCSPAVAPSAAASPAVATTPRTAVLRGPRPRGWLSDAARSGEPLIYVADGNQVLLYAEDGDRNAPIGSITDGVTSAYGLYVDREGDLYVANWQENNVEKYKPGTLQPWITYSSGLNGPFYEVVDRQGDLYVSNAGNGTVTEYVRGSTTAQRTAQTEGNQADGMDLDHEGNLYVAWRNNYGAGIDEFSSDLKHRKSLGISLVQPQGLLVRRSGEIIVVETDYASAIEEFAPGKKSPKLVLKPPQVLTEIAIARPGHTLFASSISNAVYTTSYPLRAADAFQLKILVDYSSYGSYDSVQGIALSNGQTF
jgi:streptogramin lyase